jgi:hypothetical protein
VGLEGECKCSCHSCLHGTPTPPSHAQLQRYSPSKRIRGLIHILLPCLHGIWRRSTVACCEAVPRRLAAGTPPLGHIVGHRRVFWLSHTASHPAYKACVAAAGTTLHPQQLSYRTLRFGASMSALSVAQLLRRHDVSLDLERAAAGLAGPAALCPQCLMTHSLINRRSR